MPVSRRSLLFLAGLLAARLAGRYGRLPLLFGLDLTFASIPVLIAAQLYGAPWGVAAAALAAGAGAVWDHPDGLAALAAEALLAGWLARRRREGHLVLLEAALWGGLVLPCLAWTYARALPAGATLACATLFTAGLNRTGNALAACLAVQHLPLRRWADRPDPGGARPLRRILWHLLVAVVLVAALLLLVLGSRQEQEMLDRTIRTQLASESTRIAAALRLWHRLYPEAAEAPGRVPGPGPEPVQEMLAGIQTWQELQVTLLDGTGRVMASTRPDLAPGQPYDRRAGGEVQALGGSLYQWLPAAGSPALRRQNAVYVQETPVGGGLPWTVAVEQPGRPYQQLFLGHFAQRIATLMGLCALAFLLAAGISRRLARPLAHLAEVTTGLPERLLDQGEIRWPRSSVQELAALVANFQAMAAAVRGQVLAMQQEAHQQRSLLAAALAAVDTPVLITDAADRIVYGNPAFWQEYGYTPEEALGQAPQRLLQPARPAGEPLQGWQAATAAGRSVTVELTHRRKDGTPVEVELILSPILNAAGRPSHWVGVHRNISARKAMDRMKSEFIAAVSHELRTPLCAVHASLRLLAADLAGGCLDPQADRLLAIAARNAERMVRLVDGILDLERLETGRLVLQRQVCMADALVRESVGAVQGQADQARIELEASAPAVPVLADGEKAIQVLTHLLSNALKFSAPGTRVSVRVEPAGPEVVFSVRDQGRGIPRDFLQRIFERFLQVDGSDARQQGGTGMGLAVARGLVEAMGGRIWVESEVGRGSCFYVALPAPVCSASST